MGQRTRICSPDLQSFSEKLSLIFVRPGCISLVAAKMQVDEVQLPILNSLIIKPLSLELDTDPDVFTLALETGLH